MRTTTTFRGAIAALFLLPLLGLAACSAPTLTQNERQALEARARVSLDEFEARYPQIGVSIERAYGYAVFPEITKGAVVVGGSRGTGIVYEQGEAIGTATVGQASVGAQIGGESFRELILFEDRRALNRFIRGEVEFAARAAVAAGREGGAAEAPYEDGVAVYTVTLGGLIADASIGGQQFTFRPF